MPYNASQQLQSKGFREPKKFADICISEMLEDMENRGCNVDRMVAKIAGGRQDV